MKFKACRVLFCNTLAASLAILLFSTFAVAQNEPDTDTVQEQLRVLVSSDNTDANSVREVQKLLTKLGYDPGPTDGLLGSKTRSAMKEWKASSGGIISNAWLAPRKKVAHSGWNCVSRKKADSFNGPTICGGNIKNLVVEYKSGSVAMYGRNYGWLECAYKGLANCKGITFYGAPRPTKQCSECQIYMK